MLKRSSVIGATAITTLTLLLLAIVSASACAKPAATPAPAPKPASAPDKVYTLKYAGYFPQGDVQGYSYDLYFIERAEALSKGRLKFEYFPNQQLGKHEQMLDILGGGAAQAGFFIFSYFSAMEPILAAGDLPYIWDASFTDRMKITYALVNHPDFQAGLEKHNIKVIGGDTGQSTIFFTKKPVRKLEDLKGMNLRTAGGMVGKAVKALGASAQSMASTEVYLALQTGVVDGSMSGPASAFRLKWYEVTKYATITYVNQNAYHMGKGINMDTWKSLPKDLQDALLQAGRETQERQLQVMPKLEEDSLAELQGKGTEIIRLGREETLRWGALCQPIWEEWAKETGAPGKRLLDFIISETKKYH